MLGHSFVLNLVPRLQLSFAKHPSLAGHPRIARRLAALIPGYAYDERSVFRSDGAPDEIDARRRAAFARLSSSFNQKFPKTLALTAQAKEGLSDLQFTSAYRVPFQYSAYVRKHRPVGAFLESAAGVQTRDLDGNTFYDLTGSYGVNVFGHDFYRDCMAEGAKRA